MQFATHGEKMSEKKINRKAKTKFTLLNIVRLIKDGTPPVEIYKSWGWSKDRFRYWTKKLKKLDLIRLKTRDRFCIYELTELGEEYFAQCMKQLPSSNLELHNISWIYDLKKEGTGLTHKISEKGIKTVRFRNVTVQWSNSHIWFDIVKLFGTDAFKLQDEGSSLADKVAEELKAFGFEFDNKRLMRKGHYGLIDPVVTKLAKSVELRSENYKIDESEGHGELEFFEPESVDNYLKAMVGMGKMLPQIVEQQRVFSDNLALHLKVLTEMSQTLKEIRESLTKK